MYPLLSLSLINFILFCKIHFAYCFDKYKQEQEYHRHTYRHRRFHADFSTTGDTQWGILCEPKIIKPRHTASPTPPRRRLKPLPIKRNSFGKSPEEVYVSFHYLAF